MAVHAALSFSAWAGVPAPGDSVLIVRAIEVRGNETTVDRVILREMALQVGDTLTQAAIDDDEHHIYNLGLFNKVDITYTAEEKAATVYVTVSERWYIFPYPVFGFRYRDIKKIFYGAGIVHQNFRGRNEKLSCSFALGYDQWVSLVYQNPKLTDGDDVFFRLQAGYQNLHSLSEVGGEYLQKNSFLSLSLGERFGLYQTLVGTLGYEVWQVSDPLLGRSLSPSGRDAFPTFGVRYTYDSRDVREYATDGSFAALSVMKSGFGGTDVDILTYGFDLRTFIPVWQDAALGFRSFGSFTVGGSVPTYRHVFYGYDERLRGYFSEVMEGEDILGGNVELRIPIFSPRYIQADIIPIPQFNTLRYGLYLGIFADVGQTWYRNQSPWNRQFLSGYGAGLQFILPYGVVVRPEFALNNAGVGEFFIDFGASF